MYKISIIIPVYNTENELPKTLDSIINQTMDFNDLEIILINDGSTDNTKKIMNQYSDKYSNIISIHLEKNNGSPGKPRNIGMSRATADYIMFQDSDDLYSPYACEYLYNNIVEENVDIVGGLITLKNDDDEDFIPINSWVPIIDNSSDDYEIRKKRVASILNDEKLFKIKINSIDDNVEMIKDYGFTTKIFKKSFLEKYDIKFPEGLKGGEDAVFLYNCLINANGIVFINKIISHYDTNREGINNSLTHDKSFETIKSRIKAYNLMYEISINNNKKELFIHNLLYSKLHYWFVNHLFLAKNLTDNDLKFVLKLGKNIFEEYINNNIKLYDYLYKISKSVKNEDYDEAVKLIKEKQKSFKKYLISIIIPVFNVENYIAETFFSVFNQTIGFDNLQIIFVDDCSTDHSGEIIDNYSDMYENVLSIHLKNNSGVAGRPRNIGIKYAESDYLMFLDSDDLLRNDACEKLYNMIVKENVDIVSGLYTFYLNNTLVKPKGYIKNTFTDISEKENVRLKETEQILNNPNFKLKLYSYKDQPTILGNSGFWTKIYKKDFIVENNIYFPEGITGEDSVFLFKSLLNANGLVFINDVILQYNNRRDDEDKSVSNQISKTRIVEMIDSFYKLYDISVDKNETEFFVKYLLINKLIYFIESQLFNCRLSNSNKREILQLIQPLFKESLKFMDIIPMHKNLFSLIGDDVEGAILDLNKRLKIKRENKIISVVIQLNRVIIKNIEVISTKLFQQTYENMELIFIYDYLDEKLKEFILQKNSNKQIIFKQKNQNRSWIYTGLLNSSGCCIHFIDDVLALNNDFYDQIYKMLIKEENDLIFWDNEDLEYIKQVIHNLQENYDDLYSIETLSKIPININNNIYRTTFLEEHFRDIFRTNLIEKIFMYNYYIKTNKIDYIK